MILCVNLAVGMITPPFGCCLFVACGVADIGLEAITKKILPFIGALISLISMHFLYNLDDNAQEKVK